MWKSEDVSTEPHEGPCLGSPRLSTHTASSFLTPKIPSWFYSRHCVPGWMGEVCVPSQLCWQKGQGTTADKSLLQMRAEAHFAGKSPNSGSQPAPSRAGDICSMEGELNLPAGQVLRRVVAGNVLPPQQGCPSPLPAQGKRENCRQNPAAHDSKNNCLSLCPSQK